MKFKNTAILILSLMLGAFRLSAQTNVNLRIMAANLNGNTQSYQPFALRILQGLQPDVVCIQEFNYSNNLASDFQSFLNIAFSTNYTYYREPFNGSGDIPNGIISRYPIVASGSWTDTVQSQPNRGFAWAQISLPGTNMLYVVSVHLLTSSAANRGAEAANLQALIQTNFPNQAWIVVAGDFNTGSRTESPTMTTFDSYLSDKPVPVDNLGNSDTSENRNEPHDYVLPSFSFTNLETASVLPSHSFSSGLVFDSTVYTPLSDVSPVLFTDSTNAQHMAVIKDFLIPVTGGTTAPVIQTQPQSQITSPGSNVTFSVTATGTAPLVYQWFFNSTNLVNATNSACGVTNAQSTNAGNYFVVITNVAGSVTSSVALLTISNSPPVIQIQPQSQIISPGGNATFSVSATGTAPLTYRWVFNNTNLVNATNSSYGITNAQSTNAGNYFVVITNIAGSVTSSVALLTISNSPPVIQTQPQSLSVSVGGTASFTVVAGGTAPLYYQWLENSTNLPGATASSYSKNNVQTTDAGNYSVVVTNVAGSVTSSVASLTVQTATAAVIAQWNFNSLTPDNNTTTGTTTPSTGTGTASALTVTTSFVGGDMTLDPALTTDNSAWTSTGYPAATVGNRTCGLQFAVSTAGKTNIVVSWSSESSNTGSKYGRLLYTTNGMDFTNYLVCYTNTTAFTVKTNTLAALPGVANNANFAIRLVSEFESTAIGTANATYVAAGTTYGTTGTMRYDMVTVSGTPIVTNTPVTAPVVGMAMLGSGQLQFTITGSVGSSYQVQSTTNLASGIWTSLLTNAAPYTFSDTNLNGPQKFYRAVSSP